MKPTAHESAAGNRLKIFVVSQLEDSNLPDLDYLSVIDPDRRDGVNIADNNDYSELRSHYWVWKNDLNYSHIGFFQFRRYLDLSGAERRWPYTIRRRPQAEMFSAIDHYLQYDVVGPKAEFTGESVQTRFARKHHKEDLDLICAIISDCYPEYTDAMNTYLSEEYEYYCNMYLMRKEVFASYCSWLFDILDQYVKKRTKIPPRMPGYLAERLFGIWYAKVKCEGKLKWADVPRIHFSCFDDRTHHFTLRRILNILAPPGSRICADLRKLYVSTSNI